ncbi:MAG: hypothetical protein HQL42_05725 [Alphaproteobacteria bacterium]|nr:hypothetical protein [Alphaproteobacteria bacterium]
MNTIIPAAFWTELRAYWRQRRIILAIGWIVSVGGWLVIIMLPDRYDAMTRIYVDTENLLTPLLRNITVQADVIKQIEVLQRTLLNRKNMASVAHSADLDLDLESEQDKERLYTKLSRQIVVKTEGNNLFSVTYSNSDPQMAKKIVEALLNIFVETNLGQNRSSMGNARNFIENEIANYERKLKQADSRLAEFRSRHVGVLAGEGNVSFSTRIDAAQRELTIAKAKVEDMIALRALLNANLATISPYHDVDSPGSVIISGGTATQMSARGRVQLLETEMNQLQARYTELHPDVVATRRSLEHARQQAEREALQPSDEKGARGGGRGRASNPLYEQVKLRLIQAEADLGQAQSRARIASDEASRLQTLAEGAPAIEAEAADLNREYGVIKAKYEELLGRRESARLSEAAETRGDKIQFRIIEAPQVPTSPAFPNRPLLVTAVLVMALAAGGGVVFLRQAIDDTIGSTAILAARFNLRVYGTMPLVDNVVGRARRRIEVRNFTFAAGGLFAVYIVILATAFAQQAFPSLLRLDVPAILQRVLNHVG